MIRFMHQDEVDKHYETVKKEIGEWMKNYTNSLKRVTKTQRNQMLEYAENIRFDNVNDIMEYIQPLKTVSQRDKRILEEYIYQIEWFPDGIYAGVLDGQLVSKMEPNELDLLLMETERKRKKNG